LAGDGRRVLVIDGEAGVRALFDRVLSQDGYSVTLVETVREALLAIERMAFDLVVFDLSLPGEDIVKTLQQIRCASPFSKVLVTFSRFVSGAMNIAINGGAAATLAKPTTAQELRYAVYRSLDPVGGRQ
jgi:DNA-binding NtrC family response regulator